MKNDFKLNKLLVTHLNPDLDACVAIWIFKKFIFRKEEYFLEFVPLGKKLLQSKDFKEHEIIYIDTSGGKYDHHNSSEYICAASLVMYEYSLEGNLAIKRMVDYTLAVDHGQIIDSVIDDFSIVDVIDGLNTLYPENPKLVMKKVLSYLDAIYKNLQTMIGAESDFEKVQEFETKWGKGAGIISSNPKIRYIAYKKGYKIFVFVDPTNGFRGFTAPGSAEIDLGSLYIKLRKIEPNAHWFLHSSKKLLLCGSLKAQNKKLSKLSLEQMINFVKKS